MHGMFVNGNMYINKMNFEIIIFEICCNENVIKNLKTTENCVRNLFKRLKKKCRDKFLKIINV